MTDKNDKPVVNFVVLQSVEDYVEKSGKFRAKYGASDVKKYYAKFDVPVLAPMR